MPHSTVTPPHHSPVIPGGRVATGRPVGARSWYLLLVTGLTVATVSLGPCEAERGCSRGWQLLQPSMTGMRGHKGHGGGHIPTAAAGTRAAESCSFRICMASSWGSGFFPKSLLQRQHPTLLASQHHLHPKNHLHPQNHLHPSIACTWHHLQPRITCSPASLSPPASPIPSITCTLATPASPASPALQYRLHSGITCIPASPPRQHHGRHKSPQAGEAHSLVGARGYLGGWEPRGASWHCRMMLRMSCVGRGKCSEFSREFCTSSPGHRRPTGAVGPSTRLTRGRASSSPLLPHHNGTPYQLSARRVVAGGRGLLSPLLLCPARDTMP